ncbi:Permease of the drug/metabolite transporter (DMT) superfamily [hydrothermal vent metagenome]|uniref:Permease of the drug/metabolite transporter (DMT) superfamily n=1 Tax=hydrothermal vent metagenome TaxID=652676 RepID=A0A3B0YF02_9ZZZZ
MSVSVEAQAGPLVSSRDLIQVLLVIVLWAICYPLITTGLEAFPPFHFAALRSLLAGASLLAAGIVLKRPLLPDRSTWPGLVLASLTFTALGFTGMFLAGGLVTPGLATVIANAQPLLAALIGYFVLTERLTGARGLALLVGFAGIVVIAAPGLFEQSSNSTPVGVGLVLVGATGVAIGNVILKKIASQVDPVMAMAWILLLGAVPLAVAAGIFEQDDVLHWSSASIVNLLILSVFGTALAFLGWLDLLRRTDLNMLNTYTFLTPVIALLIGMLFYNERLLTGEWFGVVVVVFSIFLVSTGFSPLIKKGKA